jgi:hypothetical protein
MRDGIASVNVDVPCNVGSNTKWRRLHERSVIDANNATLFRFQSEPIWLLHVIGKYEEAVALFQLIERVKDRWVGIHRGLCLLCLGERLRPDILPIDVKSMQCICLH